MVPQLTNEFLNLEGHSKVTLDKTANMVSETISANERKVSFFSLKVKKSIGLNPSTVFL